jgi:hypothetical protein
VGITLDKRTNLGEDTVMEFDVSRHNEFVMAYLDLRLALVVDCCLDVHKWMKEQYPSMTYRELIDWVVEHPNAQVK